MKQEKEKKTEKQEQRLRQKRSRLRRRARKQKKKRKRRISQKRRKKKNNQKRFFFFLTSKRWNDALRQNAAVKRESYKGWYFIVKKEGKKKPSEGETADQIKQLTCHLLHSLQKKKRKRASLVLWSLNPKDKKKKELRKGAENVCFIGRKTTFKCSALIWRQ